MTVDLEPFGMVNRCERLAVAPAPAGNYTVACLPFFTYGIHYGDIVEVEETSNEFLRVVKDAGLRTLRFAFNDLNFAVQSHEKLHGELVAADLVHEWHGAGYLAVLIRSVEDQNRALSCLGEFASEPWGSWEVDSEPFA